MRRPPPVIALLVLAPFLGEVLSSSTPITAFVLPWDFLFIAALYGGAALLVREAIRARNLGLAGVVALGAAYGVFEEAVLVRSWFAPEYLEAHRDYSRVWQTSLLQAVHLTAFHVAVSIGCSIALVEWLYPGHRHRPWVGRRGLAAAWVGLAALAALTLLVPGVFFPIWWPQVVAAAALATGLAVGALRLPGGWPSPRAASRRRFAGTVAACMTAHFLIVWSVPGLGVPWPWGLGLAIVSLLAGWILAIRLLPDTTDDRLSGLVLGLGWPLVALNILIGLSGRLDCLVTAAVAAAGLVWVARQHRSPLRVHEVAL